MNGPHWQDFFAMGGHGLYVWGSVGVVFAALLAEWGALVWQAWQWRRQFRLVPWQDAGDQAAEVRP